MDFSVRTCDSSDLRDEMFTGLFSCLIQAVVALLVAVCSAKPAVNAAVEETDNDDLQTAQQVYRIGFGGLGGFGGFGGFTGGYNGYNGGYNGYNGYNGGYHGYNGGHYGGHGHRK